MKIRLGRNYWLEFMTAKHYDRKYECGYAQEGVIMLFWTITLDAYKNYTEERYSDTCCLHRNRMLSIISRGVYFKCTLKEFIDNLRWTLN